MLLEDALPLEDVDYDPYRRADEGEDGEEVADVEQAAKAAERGCSATRYLWSSRVVRH